MWLLTIVQSYGLCTHVIAFGDHLNRSAWQKYADYINEQHAQTDVDNLELNWIIWNVLRMTLWNLIKTRKSYFNVKIQQLKSLYKVILTVTTPTKPTHNLYLNCSLVWHQNYCKDHPPTSHWGNPKFSRFFF